MIDLDLTMTTKARLRVLAKVKQKGYLGLDNAEVYYDALFILPTTGRMLEIGTRLGHSTTFFALAKPLWTIYTVDQWKVAAPDFSGGLGIETLGKLVREWREQGIFNIVPIVANSFDIPWELDIDALYIDGDHSYDAVKSDFERFTPFLDREGAVFMDDYVTRKGRSVQVYEFVEKELREDWDIEPVEGARGVVLWKK